jgi:hypothetical protein
MLLGRVCQAAMRAIRSWYLLITTAVAEKISALMGDEAVADELRESPVALRQNRIRSGDPDRNESTLGSGFECDLTRLVERPTSIDGSTAWRPSVMPGAGAGDPRPTTPQSKIDGPLGRAVGRVAVGKDQLVTVRGDKHERHPAVEVRRRRAGEFKKSRAGDALTAQRPAVRSEARG